MKNLAILLFSLLSCPVLAQQIQRINPPGLFVSKDYTNVVTAQGGRTVYMSGQISANAKGELLHEGDLRAQAKQACENLKLALAAAGATFDDVVKTTTFVVNSDAEKVEIVRQVWSQYSTAPYPLANTYVGVQALYDKEVLIEIEAIAVVKETARKPR